MAHDIVSTEPDQQIEYFTPEFDVTKRYQETYAKYRGESDDHDDVSAAAPICYRVKTGFTLKTHHPKAGPCYDLFRHLQTWIFPDKPISDCLVFWVPCILQGSTEKNVDKQIRLLANTRNRLGLPSHHLRSFGEISIVAGLMSAHLKHTGERVPLNDQWVRTDTHGAGGRRLYLGGFDTLGLYCNDFRFDEIVYGNVGVFAIGVEALGT